MVWDDSQTVTSLCVPDPDLTCQAAASQQHPVTGQTLDVLREKNTEHESNAQIGFILYPLYVWTDNETSFSTISSRFMDV